MDLNKRQINKARKIAKKMTPADRRTVEKALAPHVWWQMGGPGDYCTADFEYSEMILRLFGVLKELGLE